MKKIFALALAAVMTAGMTTVAFAADEITSVELGGVSTRLFEYDADNNRADHVDDTSVLEPGKTYYISLEINGVESYDKLGGDLDIDAKDMNKYKVYTDWKYGEIEDFEVAYKKIELHDGSVWGGYDYRYVIEFTTPEDNTASAFEDVAGTVKVGTTSSKADKAGSYDLSATITKDYIPEFDGDFGEFTNGAVVKFEKDLGEIDIDFEDVAMFTVNANGQGKLNLKWNTDFDPEVASLDKSANMDFVTFEGEPSFNKNGTRYIYAAEDTFLYKVVDGKLTAVDASYNEDYEAWELKTRSLGEYVISDKEIDLDAVNTEDKDDASSTTDGGKENPDTGR